MTPTSKLASCKRAGCQACADVSPRGPKREQLHAARALALGALIAFALAGCGTMETPTPTVEQPTPQAKVVTPAPQAKVVTPTPRPGAYYEDDGPGAHPPPGLDKIADAVPRVEPLNRFANKPYAVFGKDYVPLRAVKPYRERGIASWYGRKFHGQRTSSGEIYNMYAMTAAHRVLPIPSYARVTDLDNGRSVIVRINDRGPFKSGRIIDLSYAAAVKLGFAKLGSAPVEVESITSGDMKRLAARSAPTQLAEAAPAAAHAPPAGAAARHRNARTAPPAATPLATEGRGVYLQLGAFSVLSNAENFREKIASHLAWLKRAIKIFRRDGLFRVHLGPYRSRAEAGGIAARIFDALSIKPVFVTR